MFKKQHRTVNNCMIMWQIKSCILNLKVSARDSWCVWPERCWGSLGSSSWMRPRQPLTWRQTTWFKILFEKSFRTVLFSPSPIVYTASWTVQGQCHSRLIFCFNSSSSDQKTTDNIDRPIFPVTPVPRTLSSRHIYWN